MIEPVSRDDPDGANPTRVGSARNDAAEQSRDAAHESSLEQTDEYDDNSEPEAHSDAEARELLDDEAVTADFDDRA